MRRPSPWLLAVLLTVAGGHVARASRAEDADEAKKTDSFETSWFGIRAELWYPPTLSLDARVGGAQSPGGLNPSGNTKFNAGSTLGVTERACRPTEFDFVSPVALEVFVDTRWISLSAWAVTPFQYSGKETLTSDLTFAGVTFKASRQVDTTLSQALAALDIKINVINFRFLRVSPLVGLRALAIDWTVEDQGIGGVGAIKASTDDIDFPLTVGRYKVLPYPEIGAEVRAGYRDFVEADLKVSGMYVSYLGVEGTTAMIDLGVTGYLPFLPNIGMRVGYRYTYFNLDTTSQSTDRQFQADLRAHGFNLSAIVRF